MAAPPKPLLTLLATALGDARNEPDATPEQLAVRAAEKETRLQTEWRDAQVRAKLESRLKTCGIPEHGGLRLAALGASSSRTPAVEAVLAATHWREERTRALREAAGTERAGRWPAFLLLSGPPDGGKSVAMAFLLIRHELPGLWVNAQKLSTTAVGFSETDALWDAWLDADILCIEEVGFEKGDPAKIARLIFDRYNEGKMTVAAGNIPRDAFRERYEATDTSKLWSRLDKEQTQLGLDWYVPCAALNLRGLELA